MYTSRLVSPLCAVLLALLAGCREDADRIPPAKVADSPVSHRGMLTIRPEAQAAIGLAMAQAQQREVAQTLPGTGWLAVRPRGEVVIKAPTTGFIVPKIDAEHLLGRPVAKNEQLAEIEVFLSPQEQAQLVSMKEDAEKELQQAHDTLTLNEEQLERAEAATTAAVPATRLLELREIVGHARAAEEAARKKLPFLPEGAYDELHMKTVPVESPLAGRLIETHLVPRQLVVAGDPLWTIADWSRLWVRVPVFLADLPRVDQDKPANVTTPGKKKGREAQPIHAPQPAEPGKQSVELVYEIENKSGDLRPGEAVSVSLPTGAEELATVIPQSAVLWDGMGNSWVYVRAAADAFRRQRVETGELLGNQVVVRRGLNRGEVVVTSGAEALYGEEFKGQIQVEDND
jgi:cobalt-zinc-cadmium efflux system membrane fusion protein